MTSPPLSVSYAAIFGADPGPEVATSLKRLDLFLQGKVTQSTAVMLCIMLRPIDLYAHVLSAAEIQLHNATLIIGTEVTAMRSSEALVIAHQNATIARLTGENDALRRASSQTSTSSPRGTKLAIGISGTALTISVALVGWLLATRVLP